MPACVEVFKTSVLQLAPRYFVPRTPLGCGPCVSPGCLLMATLQNSPLYHLHTSRMLFRVFCLLLRLFLFLNL